MRDAVACEARAVPAAVVVLSALADIAHATARSASAPRLAIVTLDAALFGLPREEIRTIARDAAAQAVTALVGVTTIV